MCINMEKHSEMETAIYDKRAIISTCVCLCLLKRLRLVEILLMLSACIFEMQNKFRQFLYNGLQEVSSS